MVTSFVDIYVSEMGTRLLGKKDIWQGQTSTGFFVDVTVILDMSH
jgi:hypothetical protein